MTVLEAVKQHAHAVEEVPLCRDVSFAGCSSAAIGARYGAGARHRSK
ncbi:hypothetical protein [Streptomyces sp. LN549]